jgi:CPA1 family monovalent cation:H+ antiporter
VHGGGPVPDRELVIFLAFCVLLATLVVQGLTLAPLIRALGVEDDGLDRDEELAARLETAYAAMDRLEELKDEDWVYDDTIDRARRLYDFRRRRFASRIDGTGEHEDRSAAYQRLQRELIDAQRAKLVELRNAGRISDGVRRAVERDLDLEESRLES